MRFKKKLKNDAIYHFIRLTIFFFNTIPRGMAVGFGSLIGYLGFLLYKKDRYRANRHLRLVYGDSLNLCERRQIVRDMFINIGKNTADVVRMKRYYRDQIKPLIDVEGMEYVDKVYKRGNGVICITGHIGNFELLGAYFASENYKVAAIGRKIYDKRLNRILVENREAIGLVNVDTKDSPGKILKLLKNGYMLGALIDTDSFRVKSKLIPAFGRLSNTPVGQSLLGLRSGAGFIPTVCVRKGKRYKIIIKPEITVEKTGNISRDLYNITSKCNAVMEEIINEYKDQWIWMHNRWRTRAENTG